MHETYQIFAKSNYRFGNDKCKIFQKKQLTFPIDLSKILHLELPIRYKVSDVLKVKIYS